MGTEQSNQQSMEQHPGFFGFLMAFILGAVAVNTAEQNSATLIQQIQNTDPAIWDFLLRSIIGGGIALLIRIAGDAIVNRRNRNKKQGE